MRALSQTETAKYFEWIIINNPNFTISGNLRRSLSEAVFTESVTLNFSISLHFNKAKEFDKVLGEILLVYLTFIGLPPM